MSAGRKSSTVRDMLDAKSEKIRRNRDDFRKRLGESPRAVQDEYRRCAAGIDAILRRRGRDRMAEAAIYPAAGKPASLTGIQAAWLLDLLSHPANGWDVSLSKPLRSSDDSETRIVFRFDPSED